MNIVIISSDKTLVGGQGVGDAVVRHRHYGEFVNRLDIIVYTHKKEGLTDFMISDKARGYPSNSSSKLMFFFEAVKIFEKIHNVHKCDLIICQDPFVFGLVGLWLKNKYGVKLEMNFHGDHWDNPYWLNERPLNHLFLWMSKYTVPRADGIRVVSRFIKEKLIKHGIPENKIRVIPTPINLERFKSYSQDEVVKIRRDYAGRKIILFVGRLWPVKNLPLLVESFALVKKACPESVLLIVGAGREKEDLEKIIKSLDLSSDIDLTGAFAPAKLVNYFYAADIFVLPSLSEGRPKALIEAAACGLPLVAANFPGANEIVHDGENGFLTPAGDKSALAEKLLILLKDGGLRQKMGVKSEEFAKELAIDTTPELARFWQEIVTGKI
jgi:glycosyltransferase involved in cell wall biosynthesis